MDLLGVPTTLEAPSVFQLMFFPTQVSGGIVTIAAVANALFKATVSSVAPSHLAPQTRTSIGCDMSANQHPFPDVGATCAPSSPSPLFSKQGEEFQW